MTRTPSGPSTTTHLALAAAAAIGGAIVHARGRRCAKQEVQARQQERTELALAVLEAYAPKPPLLTGRGLEFIINVVASLAVAAVVCPLVARAVPSNVAWTAAGLTFIASLAGCEKVAAWERKRRTR